MFHKLIQVTGIIDFVDPEHPNIGNSVTKTDLFTVTNCGAVVPEGIVRE